MRTGMRPSEKHTAGSVTESFEEVQRILHLQGWFPKEDVWEAWFRGQSAASWRLQPKLYRGSLPPKKQLRETEVEIREEFIKRAPILCEA